MVFCPFHRVLRVAVALTVARLSPDDGEALHTLGRTRVFTGEGLERGAYLSQTLSFQNLEAVSFGS